MCDFTDRNQHPFDLSESPVSSQERDGQSDEANHVQDDDSTEIFKLKRATYSLFTKQIYTEGLYNSSFPTEG